MEAIHTCKLLCVDKILIVQSSSLKMYLYYLHNAIFLRSQSMWTIALHKGWYSGWYISLTYLSINFHMQLGIQINFSCQK